MPWKSGSEFAKKHWKKGGKKAGKARRIAEAIIASDGDEGIAIATGIARAKGQKRKKRGGRIAGNPARAAAKRK